jgi:hypothetical protein
MITGQAAQKSALTVYDYTSIIQLLPMFRENQEHKAIPEK